MPDQHIVTGGVGVSDSIHHTASIQRALADVVAQEAEALAVLSKNFPTNAFQLVDLILQTPGKIFFSGVGKSGLVAQKLAATFSSLSLPALFLHPVESLHGDLGVVQKGDLFIALSKSGSGDELANIFSLIRSRGVLSVLMCCKQGPLCTKADLIVQLFFQKEACPLNLAPTTSSTAMMAFGDAVAVVAAKIRGFTAIDFARNHPAGSLGKRLFLTVQSLMHPLSELPLLQETTPFEELIVEISSKKLGVGIVVDVDGMLLGVITDGDLRRACSMGAKVFSLAARDILSLNPKTASPHAYAYDALKVMEDHHITSLIVAEQERVVGLVHIHDLIKAGL